MSGELESQYRDTARLAARGRLHAKYSRIDWFAWVAERLDLPPGARVLDLGCGAGWFWSGRLGAGLDVELTLCDLSAGMVRAALANLDGAAGACALVADASALPLQEGAFDAVVAMHMLYHLPDPEAGLSEIARVLKPGGRVFVTTNGADSLRRLHRLAAAAYPAPDSDPAAQVFGIAQAEAALRERFSGVATQRCLDVLDCSDPKDVRDYLLSLPAADAATADQRAALDRLIAEAFARGGGRLRLEKESGLIVGTRC